MSFENGFGGTADLPFGHHSHVPVAMVRNKTAFANDVGRSFMIIVNNVGSMDNFKPLVQVRVLQISINLIRILTCALSCNHNQVERHGVHSGNGTNRTNSGNQRRLIDSCNRRRGPASI